jgi:hypothetical protein
MGLGLMGEFVVVININLIFIGFLKYLVAFHTSCKLLLQLSIKGKVETWYHQKLAKIILFHHVGRESFDVSSLLNS